MFYMIEIINLTEKEINNKLVKETCEKVLRKEKIKGDIEIALVGPSRIRKINKIYRNKNKATDILSFEEKKFPFEEKIAELNRNKLGDLIICPARIKKTAKREGIEFETLLVRVLIHGILHLLGYNHQERGEAKIMEEKEKKYLNYILNS